MSEPSTKELLNVAVKAVRTAGKHALSNRVRRNEVIMRDTHDVKLALDVECQKIATAVIADFFPEHKVLGEEDTTVTTQQKALHDNQNRAKNESSQNQDYEWIIDPIDGTVNFSHGMRQWCCSIAVRRQNRILAGAVYGPELDELYTATADGPAMLNGETIKVSACSELKDAIVCTGMDKNVTPEIPPFALFRAIAGNTQKARIMGSAALDLCHVARGEVDAYFETGIYIWDVAAAGLVIEQAGGQTAVMRNLPDARLMYMASNGRIHDALTELINTAAAND